MVLHTTPAPAPATAPDTVTLNCEGLAKENPEMMRNPALYYTAKQLAQEHTLPFLQQIDQYMFDTYKKHTAETYQQLYQCLFNAGLTTQQSPSLLVDERENAALPF